MSKVVGAGRRGGGRTDLGGGLQVDILPDLLAGPLSCNETIELIKESNLLSFTRISCQIILHDKVLQGRNANLGQHKNFSTYLKGTNY